MILEPICSERECIHYLGISQPDGTEMSERPVCKAYPDEIPHDIQLGYDMHLDVRSDQDNDIVYEMKPDAEISELF